MRLNSQACSSLTLTTELVYFGQLPVPVERVIVCTYASQEENPLKVGNKSWSYMGLLGVQLNSEQALAVLGRPLYNESPKVPHMHHIETIGMLRERGFRTSSKTLVTRSELSESLRA